MTTLRAFAARMSAVWIVLAYLSTPAAPVAAQQLIRPSGAPITVDVSKGVLISLDRPADTVFVADPAIADVQVKSPRLIYLYGKAPGATSLYAVDADQKVMLSRPVSVSRDVGQLQAAISKLQPGSGVHVSSVDKSLVLTGNVGTASAAEEVKNLAGAFVSDDKQIVNRVTVDRPYQVNLRVRIAEVARSVTKELGFNWDLLGRPGSFAFGLATGNPALGLPTGSNGALTAIGAPVIPTLLTDATGKNAVSFINRNAGAGGTKTDSFELGFNNGRTLVDSVIDALDQNGLVTILAEPNLTAMSGETASFLAGGEFPIIIPSGSLGQTTVEFKQYGVSLAFTPVVLGDNRISMRVRPEVSELSNTGAVQISGTNIPGITTRRAETSIELNSGQSFAIGGLLQNDNSDTINKVPGLGDLPILGPLFRSTQFQHNESELVIIVTPYLVQPSSRPLATPLDGYASPTDADIYKNGITTRQIQAYSGTDPTAVAATAQPPVASGAPTMVAAGAPVAAVPTPIVQTAVAAAPMQVVPLAARPAPPAASAPSVVQPPPVAASGLVGPAGFVLN
jgi:pilus assembly protein CpaC